MLAGSWWDVVFCQYSWMRARDASPGWKPAWSKMTLWNYHTRHVDCILQPWCLKVLLGFSVWSKFQSLHPFSVSCLHLHSSLEGQKGIRKCDKFCTQRNFFGGTFLRKGFFDLSLAVKRMSEVRPVSWVLHHPYWRADPWGGRGWGCLAEVEASPWSQLI